MKNFVLAVFVKDYLPNISCLTHFYHQNVLYWPECYILFKYVQNRQIHSKHLTQLL